MALLQSILPLNPQDRLADIGCGSGVQIIELSRRVAEVVGFDYSAQMLVLARQRIMEEGIRNAVVRLCDVYHLDSEDAEFDAIIALGLVDYLDDVRRALSEMARICKDGGRLVVTMPKSPSMFSFLRRGLGLWLRMKVLHLPPILFTAGKSLAVELVEGAGFHLVDIRALWSTMWIISAVRVGRETRRSSRESTQQ